MCDMAVELCVLCGALSCSYGEKLDKQDHDNLGRKSHVISLSHRHSSLLWFSKDQRF